MPTLRRVRTRRSRCASAVICAVAALSCAVLLAELPPNPKLGTVSRNNDRSNRDSETSETGVCKFGSDCDDGDACTVDLCHVGECLSIPVPDCKRCEVEPVCTAVDIVFMMDTSGSMRDEAAALCGGIEPALTFLRSTGLEVRATVLAINSYPRLGFECLEDTVVDSLGADVPGDAGTCAFPDGSAPNESWGPATSIVAARFDWLPEATRMIVPLADEGPCNGTFPDGCNNPGDDFESIQNAIAVATAEGVVVSPMLGTGSDDCVIELATLLADGTGGITLETKDPQRDLIEGIVGLVESLCMPDLSCDDNQPCTDFDTCRDGVCIGRPVADCQFCETILDCEDFSACTNKSCVGGRCHWTPNFDVQSVCCYPSDGSHTFLDDDDECTDDLCDIDTGAVSHDPTAAGAPCDDGRACSVADACDGGGVCRGEDIGFTECKTDDDCLGHMCDLDSGTCFCEGAPELCLNAVPGSLPSSGCYMTGDEIIVLVELASSDRTITAGQFSIGYDPSALRYISVLPGKAWDLASPFELELDRDVDENVGRVFYAVGIPLGGFGARQAAVMAMVRFEAIDVCADVQTCFADSNPFNSLLTDDTGQAVSITPCCSSSIKINGRAPEITCPSSSIQNADAGVFTASVIWDPVAASGTCEGPLDVACDSTHSMGADVAHLELSGGTHPAGVTTYSCEATDSCGATMTCDWGVEVFEFNSVSMELQVDTMTFGGPATRCVEVELYTTCDQPPIVRSRNVKFGGGIAASVSLSVPIAQYSCVSVRDPMHTLRASSTLQVVDGKYVASFVGNPGLGGNSLRGGDLNDDGVVDLIDLAIVTSPDDPSPGADSQCGTALFHADLTGDGIVTASDVAVAESNFNLVDTPACCSLGTIAGVATPRTEATVQLLTESGVKDASAMDLDGDGKVTASELRRFADGDRRKAVSTRVLSSIR